MKKILNLVIITIITILVVSCDPNPVNKIECVGEMTFGEITSELTEN